MKILVTPEEYEQLKDPITPEPYKETVINGVVGYWVEFKEVEFKEEEEEWV